MADNASDARLALPQVTLCAASSVNVAATIRALECSMAGIDFAACKLFTDADVVPDHPGITVVPSARLGSAAAYSDFILTGMPGHVETSHCLIVQWDGHVIDAGRWQPAFLDHDYIGASWPQFTDGHDVGNGGFSLRSRRLMQLCRSAAFQPSHPEDVTIGRSRRRWLEDQGMRFALRGLADEFSAERAGDPRFSFGYHGVWHMPQVIGTASFWNIYLGLDDRGTIRHDLLALVNQVIRGPGGAGRAWRLLVDRALSAGGGRREGAAPAPQHRKQGS